MTNVTESLTNLSINDSKEKDQDESEVFNQLKGYEARKLTQEELDKLARDKCLVSEFKHNKFELEAKKNWDLFYRRNKANFFKDRYWTFREFDILNNNADSDKKEIVLEIGCGVGNFMYPLIKHNKNVFVYACDFSTDAIQLLKSNPDYDTQRCLGFVCDLTKENSLRESLPPGVLCDVVTLIFVLSAIHPTKMKQCVRNIAQVLKPGGICLIRDYGVNDHSMIRFDPGHKLGDKFYVRQDGTRTYYFSLEEINNLFLTTNDAKQTSQQTGETCTNANNDEARLFDKQISEYVFRETVNFKENLRVPRVFIQSKFIRRESSSLLKEEHAS